LGLTKEDLITKAELKVEERVYFKYPKGKEPMTRKKRVAGEQRAKSALQSKSSDSQTFASFLSSGRLIFTRRLNKLKQFISNSKIKATKVNE
jgi:LPS sulfotransferase NodH